MSLGATSVSGWVNHYAQKFIAIHLGSAIVLRGRRRCRCTTNANTTSTTLYINVVLFSSCLVYLFPHVIAVLLVLLTDLLVHSVYLSTLSLLYDLELDDDYYPLATYDRLVISSPLFHYMSLMTRYLTYFRHAERGFRQGGGGRRGECSG